MEHESRIADFLTFIVWSLVLFGLVMIYSSIAAGNRAVLMGIPLTVWKQLLYIAAGMAMFTFFAHYDYAKWERRMPFLIWGVVLLLLTVYLPHVQPVRGTRAWVPLGPVAIQPSEFAKLGLVVYLAVAFYRARDMELSFVRRRIVPLLATLLVLGLIALEGDKGMTLFVGITVFLLWFVSGARMIQVGALCALFIVAMGAVVMESSYARQRVMDYVEQYRSEPVESYQLLQGKIAFASGGATGAGIGGGMTRLPDRHTDFIFAIVGEEWGFVGAIGTVLAYATLIGLGFTIAARCPDLLGTLLATGVTILIGFQAVLNLCVTTGAAPTTGIGLPFISYGGSSLISSLAGIGILVNIARLPKETRLTREAVSVMAKHQNNLRIAFAAGGTGGHVFPAMAVIDALRGRVPTASVAYAGRAEGLEQREAAKRGLAYLGLRMKGFRRRISTDLVIVPIMTIVAVIRCLGWLARQRPDVVVGFGGYASWPALFAAVILRRRTVLHEQNRTPGLANRLLAPWVGTVLVSDEDAKALLPRARVIGVPIRANVIGRDRAEGLAQWNLRADQRTVFVFGGSLGARALCDAACDAFRTLQSRGVALQAILQTGAKSFAEIKQQALPESVRVVEFIDDMGAAYAVADLVVARAGAVSVAEITANGLPAIYVPFPYATGRHQHSNAGALERAGAALMIDQDNLNGTMLADTLAELLCGDRLPAMAAASRKQGRPRAAEDFVDCLLELTNRKEEAA